MFKLKVTGVEETVGMLTNGASAISPEIEQILDKLAHDTANKMSNEAPRGKTGELKFKIEIQAGTGKRMIEPTAKNLSGMPYAQYVEEGTGPGYFPNVDNLMNYYALTKGGAWMLAKKIRDVGTKANPFVKRTFDWISAQIHGLSKQFADKIVADFISYR